MRRGTDLNYFSHWPEPTPSAYGDSDSSLTPSVITTTTTVEATGSTSSSSPSYESQSKLPLVSFTTTYTTASFVSASSSAVPAYDSEIPLPTTPPQAYTTSNLRSSPIPHAGITDPQSAELPGSTSSSFFSTITIKTTMFTTVCPTTSIHVTNGRSYTSTHVGTTTVYSTYHMTMPCHKCGSWNASSGVPDRATPPYPAGNSTVPYMPTFSPSSSLTPSSPPDSTVGNDGIGVSRSGVLMAMLLLGTAIMLL